MNFTPSPTKATGTAYQYPEQPVAVVALCRRSDVTQCLTVDSLTSHVVKWRLRDGRCSAYTFGHAQLTPSLGPRDFHIFDVYNSTNSLR